MQTNLNMLFQQLIPNFAHLVKTENMTKEQFLETIKSNYCLSNQRTNLFYNSVIQSTFKTIRLTPDRTSLLFNQ